MRRLRLHPQLLGLALLSVVVTACGLSVTGLNFFEDERVSFVEPRHREVVALPVTLRWDVDGFDVVPPDGHSRDSDKGYFAVLLNADPMPPGDGLEYFARRDESCLRSATCPDEAYLAERGIHLVVGTELTLDALRDTRRHDERHRSDLQEASIILLDQSGRRIGESVWFVRFVVDRGDQIQGARP